MNDRLSFFILRPDGIKRDITKLCLLGEIFDDGRVTLFPIAMLRNPNVEWEGNNGGLLEHTLSKGEFEEFCSAPDQERINEILSKLEVGEINQLLELQITEDRTILSTNKEAEILFR